MAEPLVIEEPAAARPRPRPSLDAFLSLGFRPLYIAGSAWAVVAVAIWIFAPALIGAPLSGVAWHAHEMLWGFIATIAVAFLLTASANWTGINPLRGAGLGATCLLWLVARLGYLFGGTAGFWLAAACESAFFLVAALSLLRVMHKAHSRRNYGIPWLVLGLGAANLLYLQAALRGDHAVLIQRFDLGLLCMAVIALLIARRVIPFFAMRAVTGLKIPMLTRSGQVQVALGLAAIAAALAGLPHVAAPALAVAALIGLFQVWSWRPLAARANPLLWILYLGYTALSLGLLAAGAYLGGLESGPLARPATYVHIVAMGGFSILIIGMITRTALGHLGKPLRVDRSMLWSYVLIIAAALLRLAALWPTASGQGLLHAAAACWIAGLALYLWRFVPMLIRPRPDAAPQPQPQRGQVQAAVVRGPAQGPRP
ncbi:NnrS family protein [Candidimonas humi]|uniref:NnrS family protein n=1 Tax=Candidimonas humi TaxID=683355 RepID=A0ABV8P0T5_9BURK|nr:NnrS family protein [Candidimonas humi]MBV6306236.1 NnrS family protein [Candidimonas humi]